MAYKGCDICEYLNGKLHEQLTSYLENREPGDRPRAVEGMRDVFFEMRKNVGWSTPKSCRGCQYQESALPDAYFWRGYWDNILKRMDREITPAERKAAEPVPEEIMV